MPSNEYKNQYNLNMIITYVFGPDADEFTKEDFKAFREKFDPKGGPAIPRPQPGNIVKIPKNEDMDKLLKDFFAMKKQQNINPELRHIDYGRGHALIFDSKDEKDNFFAEQALKNRDFKQETKPTNIETPKPFSDTPK